MLETFWANCSKQGWACCPLCKQSWGEKMKLHRMLRGNCLKGLVSPHGMPFKRLSPQMQKTRRFHLSLRNTSIKMTSSRIYPLLYCCQLKQHKRTYLGPSRAYCRCSVNWAGFLLGCSFPASLLMWKDEPTYSVWLASEKGKLSLTLQSLTYGL